MSTASLDQVLAQLSTLTEEVKNIAASMEELKVLPKTFSELETLTQQNRQDQATTVVDILTRIQALSESINVPKTTKRAASSSVTKTEEAEPIQEEAAQAKPSIQSYFKYAYAHEECYTEKGEDTPILEFISEITIDGEEVLEHIKKTNEKLRDLIQNKYDEYESKTNENEKELALFVATKAEGSAIYSGLTPEQRKNWKAKFYDYAVEIYNEAIERERNLENEIKKAPKPTRKTASKAAAAKAPATPAEPEVKPKRSSSRAPAKNKVVEEEPVEEKPATIRKSKSSTVVNKPTTKTVTKPKLIEINESDQEDGSQESSEEEKPKEPTKRGRTTKKN